MSIEIKVPVLPESVADAVIAAWSKKVGEAVSQDETLVDLETDKVILEVPAISDGVLKEIYFKQGDVVTAGQVLAVIDDSASAKLAVNENLQNPEKDQEARHEIDHGSAAISPSARKLMDEYGLSEADVTGSGRAGRVLKEDVQKTIISSNALDKPVKKKESETKTTGSEILLSSGDRIEKRVPMTRLRARIAERLVEAQHNAAILTTFNEVNMKPVMDLRQKYKEPFEKEHGVRLGFMSFFIRAAVEALKKFPDVNASIDGDDVVYHGYFDIGVAVSGKNGLVVPVLRNVDSMSIAEIEKEILAYAIKAKENTLTMDEITGGTFTISNGGVFGSMLSTPILNPPQSAILGMHNIKERAMVENAKVIVLPMMYLALSYDHRIIDGREAVQFLVTIKEMLEDPSRMMLGV